MSIRLSTRTQLKASSYFSQINKSMSPHATHWKCAPATRRMLANCVFLYLVFHPRFHCTPSIYVPSFTKQRRKLPFFYYEKLDEEIKRIRSKIGCVLPMTTLCAKFKRVRNFCNFLSTLA